MARCGRNTRGRGVAKAGESALSAGCRVIVLPHWLPEACTGRQLNRCFGIVFASLSAMRERADRLILTALNFSDAGRALCPSAFGHIGSVPAARNGSYSKQPLLLEATLHAALVVRIADLAGGFGFARIDSTTSALAIRQSLAASVAAFVLGRGHLHGHLFSGRRRGCSTRIPIPARRDRW